MNEASKSSISFVKFSLSDFGSPIGHTNLNLESSSPQKKKWDP